MDSDRYKRGLEKLKKIDGHAGERVIESLKDIALISLATLLSFPLATCINVRFFR